MKNILTLLLIIVISTVAKAQSSFKKRTLYQRDTEDGKLYKTQEDFFNGKTLRDSVVLYNRLEEKIVRMHFKYDTQNNIATAIEIKGRDTLSVVKEQIIKGEVVPFNDELDKIYCGRENYKCKYDKNNRITYISQINELTGITTHTYRYVYK